MKIRVDFTVEIDDADSLAILRDLESGTALDVGEGRAGIREMREYVRAEAEDSLCGYLEGNGVKLRRVRSVYGPSS